MQFARAVEVYEQIEATTKRLEMTGLLVSLLRDTPPEDLDKVVYLTQGRIHPDYLGIELGLAEKMVIRVLAHATGLEEDRVEKLWKEKGDLGLVAEQVIASRRVKYVLSLCQRNVTSAQQPSSCAPAPPANRPPSCASCARGAP